MLERRQADAVGKVRQLTRRHVASSRKPSGVAVVRMSSSSRESRGPSPWPGRARPSSPVTLSHPPQTQRLRQHISAPPLVARMHVAGQVGDPRPPRAVSREAFPRRTARTSVKQDPEAEARGSVSSVRWERGAGRGAGGPWDRPPSSARSSSALPKPRTFPRSSASGIHMMFKICVV